MASSSSRKSNSSASNGKPTFRRSTGAAPRPRAASPSGAPRGRSTAPATPAARKPAARTYAAPTKKTALLQTSSARAAHPGAPRSRTGAGRQLPARAGQAPSRAAAPLRPAASRAKAVPRLSAQPARTAARPTAQPATGPKRPASPRRKAAPSPKPSRAHIGSASASRSLADRLGIGRRAQSAPRPEKAPASTAAAPRESRPSGRAGLARVIVVLALALVVVLGAGAAVVVNSGLFAVTDVVVNGSDHIPQQTAEQLVAIPEGATLFNVSDEEVASALLQNPWVTGVDIERRFPHTIVVTPREREVAAVAYIVADDVAWAIGTDDTWIAPLSLSSAASSDSPTGDGASADDGATADGVSTDDAGSTDASSNDGASADASGSSDGSDSADASADGVPATGAGASGSGSSSNLDAALKVASDNGAVLFTDVGTDVEPASGQKVDSEVVLAGLEYVRGFSDGFLAQIKDISLTSVESISANLVSGVEVSLGSPSDISRKEQVVLQLLEQQSGVTYINVRTPDAYSFRSADVS